MDSQMERHSATAFFIARTTAAFGVLVDREKVTDAALDQLDGWEGLYELLAIEASNFMVTRSNFDTSGYEFYEALDGWFDDRIHPLLYQTTYH